jgi:hypothetical protein
MAPYPSTRCVRCHGGRAIHEPDRGLDALREERVRTERARYEQHLVTGQPLPPETVAYVMAVTPLLADEQGEHAAFRIRRAVPWREA